MVLDRRHFIAEAQFAAFQPCQQQLVEVRRGCQRRNRVVQIAVLDPQQSQPLLKVRFVHRLLLSPAIPALATVRQRFSHVVPKIPSDMATFARSCVLLISPTAKQEDATMQSAHLTALEAKHATLDRQISAETHRPAPDQSLLSSLKKRKLQVKQEISSL